MSNVTLLTPQDRRALDRQDRERLEKQRKDCKDRCEKVQYPVGIGISAFLFMVGAAALVGLSYDTYKKGTPSSVVAYVAAGLDVVFFGFLAYFFINKQCKRTPDPEDSNPLSHEPQSGGLSAR